MEVLLDCKALIVIVQDVITTALETVIISSLFDKGNNPWERYLWIQKMHDSGNKTSQI